MIRHSDHLKPRQVKKMKQRDASLPKPKDYPEREPEPWKPLGLRA